MSACVQRVRNKKTGRIYVVVGAATDCTNVREGTPVVLYRRADSVGGLWVRETREFNDKFEPLEGDAPDPCPPPVVSAEAGTSRG